MGKLFCLLVSIIAIASASDDKTDRATLKGVKAVCAVVEVTDQVQARLKKEELQTAIEEKLKQAGIPIEKDGTACVYLNVRALQAIGRALMGRKERAIPLYAVDLRLEFLQMAALTRDPSAKTYTPTWSSANMAMVPADQLNKTAQEITASLVDQWIAAYRSVNPK